LFGPVLPKNLEIDLTIPKNLEINLRIAFLSGELCYVGLCTRGGERAGTT